MTSSGQLLIPILFEIKPIHIKEKPLTAKETINKMQGNLPNGKRYLQIIHPIKG